MDLYIESGWNMNGFVRVSIHESRMYWNRTWDPNGFIRGDIDGFKISTGFGHRVGLLSEWIRACSYTKVKCIGIVHGIQMDSYVGSWMA